MRRAVITVPAVLVALAARRVLEHPAAAVLAAAADAVTPAGAQAATAAFGARPGTRPRDAALPFAWSTAATIEPWVEGREFFPRILADVEAATSSVHILMFGWREGEIGMRLAALLERKLADGVEVRVIVDGLGSRPYWSAREMFTRPRGGGRGDRRQRRAAARQARPVPGRPAARPAAERARPRGPSQALRRSTGRSRGRAARGSRTTSTTASSTT